MPETGNFIESGHFFCVWPMVLTLSDFPVPARASRESSNLKSPKVLISANSFPESKFSEKHFSAACAHDTDRDAPITNA